MWKAYFVIILIISILSYIWQGLERFYEFLDMVLFALALTGSYGYAWGKKFSARDSGKFCFLF